MNNIANDWLPNRRVKQCYKEYLSFTFGLFLFEASQVSTLLLQFNLN